MPSAQRLPALDALRGWAALYVLLYHASVPLEFTWPALKRFFLNGGYPVQLFFCASGYLILHSQIRRDGSASAGNWHFFLRRSARILPLWWIVLAVEFFLGSFSANILLVNAAFLFGFVSFLPGYLPVRVAWSLFVEEIFYLLWPTLYPWVRKGRNVAIGLVGCFLLAIAWEQLAHHYGVPNENNFISWNPLSQLHFFFLGFALYGLHHSAWYRENFAGRGWRFTWLDAFALLGFSSNVFWVWTLPELLVPLFFLAATTPGTLLHQTINNTFFRWAGIRCYGIYLIHLSVSYRLPALLPNGPGELQLAINATLSALITLTLAALSFRLVERPLIQLVEQKT